MQQIQTQKGYKKEKFLFGFQQIPESWTIKKLIELCNEKPQYGAAVSALPKNTDLPRYIRITDLNDDGSLKANEWKSISEKVSKPYLLAEDEILFARTGATVGKTYLYNKKHGKCAFAGYLIRFKPEKNKLIPEYLFHYTHSSYYWKWLRSIQTEGVQPNVNAEQYSNMLLLCPPLQEQQKIASILSTVDELIQKTEQIIEQTQRLKKGLMQRLLTKGLGHTKFRKTELGEIPKQWNIVEIDEITSKITDIDHKMPKKVEQGIPFITVKYLTRDDSYYFNLNHDADLEYILEEDFEHHSKKFNAEYGDLLFSRYGTIGVTKMINTKEKLIASYSIALIKPKREIIFPLFLTHVLNSDKIKRQIQSFIEQSSNTNLDLLRIKKIKIPKPNLREQQKISSIISYIDLLVQKRRELKIKYENLKKGLMQQLLTGKIRVKV